MDERIPTFHRITVPSFTHLEQSIALCLWMNGHLHFKESCCPHPQHSNSPTRTAKLPPHGHISTQWNPSYTSSNWHVTLSHLMCYLFTYILHISILTPHWMFFIDCLTVENLDTMILQIIQNNSPNTVSYPKDLNCELNIT
jgi:hypothetical protein